MIDEQVDGSPCLVLARRRADGRVAVARAVVLVAAGVADELGECLRADPERRGAVELGDAALA